MDTRKRDPYLRSLVEGVAQVMKARRIGLITSDEEVEERVARCTRRFFEGKRRRGEIA